MTQSAPRIEEVPECYSKSWKASAIVCNGGEDPDYFDPVLNDFRRRPCRFVENCSRLVKNAAPQIIPISNLRSSAPAVSTPQPPPAFTPPRPAQQQAPPPGLGAAVRQYQGPFTATAQPQQAVVMPPVGPPDAAEMLRQQLRAQELRHAQELGALRAHQAQVQAVAAAPQQQAPQQPHYPYPPHPPPYAGPQFQAVNFDTPYYLSQPEPYRPGSFWSRFMTELGRASVKGLGQQLAAFVDKNNFWDGK